jgi:hypothetical protein
VVMWIEASFDQKLGFATRHVHELQLSFRLTNGCPMPKSMTEESSCSSTMSVC